MLPQLSIVLKTQLLLDGRFPHLMQAVGHVRRQRLGFPSLAAALADFADLELGTLRHVGALLHRGPQDVIIKEPVVVRVRHPLVCRLKFSRPAVATVANQTACLIARLVSFAPR